MVVFLLFVCLFVCLMFVCLMFVCLFVFFLCWIVCFLDLTGVAGVLNYFYELEGSPSEVAGVLVPSPNQCCLWCNSLAPAPNSYHPWCHQLVPPPKMFASLCARKSSLAKLISNVLDVYYIETF